MDESLVPHFAHANQLRFISWTLSRKLNWRSLRCFVRSLLNRSDSMGKRAGVEDLSGLSMWDMASSFVSGRRNIRNRRRKTKPLSTSTKLSSRPISRPKARA